MGITQKQRERRKQYIGSSDSPAIFGVDPFKNEADLQLIKLGMVADDKDDPAKNAGRHFEEGLLTWAAEKLGVTIRRNQFRVADNGIMAASNDALVVDHPTWGIEAKTTAMFGFANKEELEQWGADGSDEVPARILIQCHHQAIVADLDVVWVPALIPRIGLRLYRVERNADLANTVEAEVCKWWQEHVIERKPVAETPSLDVLKRVRREPNKVVALPEELFEDWRATAGVLKVQKDREEAAKAALIEALGDAEAGDLPDGTRVTYFETKRKGYTVADTTFRQLRIKEPSKCQLLPLK